ncbi:Homeobox protein TGIF2 [Ceratocystis platani]|uniref:Homeobox protein TGIF2 n=1 Tax=Ceratocystis fimbriata f. sp. platani TaxID=88771 RepID=A0A0F8CN38_CERFI|nr:Homeobox protein TGIF2 [Ceratocystis platani]
MSTLATPARPLQTSYPHQSLHLSRNMIQSPNESRDGPSISLPSLNQMLPEFYSTPSPNNSDSRSPRAYLAPLTSPDYVHSPTSNKRRRASIEEDDAAERSSRVPRVYPSPVTDAASAASRSPSMRDASWSATPAPGPTRSEPRAPLPPMSYPREPAAPHPHGPAPTHHAAAHGHALPPHAPAPAPAASAPPMPQHPYSTLSPREEQYMHHPAAAAPAAPHPHAHAHYQQRYTSVPPHHQYASAHMAHGHPHVANGPAPYGYDHYQRFEGMAAADTKQRKRRGNLPKETTDKLRHWFMNHLNHPYPTENEKMELMRMTGLQMNQISNWFINARRRQLPNIMSTARNEAEARYNQTNGNKGSSVPLSDGDNNSSYGDDAHYKRTSV